MAYIVNVTIDQGETFETTIYMTDSEANDAFIDLSTFTGDSAVKRHYTSLANTATFDVNTTANGEVILSMDSNTTNLLLEPRYVYDIKLTANNGRVSYPVKGEVLVKLKVTD